MSELQLERTATAESTYKRKSVQLPTYAVRLDGEVVGYVRRAMVTHERKTPGMRYVNARWQSPGWKYGADRWTRWECSSRRDGIERLLRDAGLSWGEAETLAATARATA